MKKLLLILLIMFFGVCTYGAETDYEQIYRDLEPANFSYVHDIDPGEMYDTQDNHTHYLDLHHPYFLKIQQLSLGIIF